MPTCSLSFSGCVPGPASEFAEEVVLGGSALPELHGASTWVDALAGEDPLSKGVSGIARLRMVEFHRFLMALSVRPGRRLLISTQWLPSSMCACSSTRSSSSDQPSFLMFGSSWLCHLSLHCLPVPVCASERVRAPHNAGFVKDRSSSLFNNCSLPPRRPVLSRHKTLCTFCGVGELYRRRSPFLVSYSCADHRPIRIGGERERPVTASPVMTKSRGPSWGQKNRQALRYLRRQRCL